MKFMNKRLIALLSVLAILPSIVLAQETSQNYVKSVTMLTADGTESLLSVQYFNGLGFPTLSVATAGTQGGTVSLLTTYDGCGRENRKYAPVPGIGIDYATESTILSKGVFYSDNSAFTQNHYDALDRLTAVDLAGDAWRNAGKQNRTEYLANVSSDLVLHYKATDASSCGLVQPENTSYMYYPEGSLRKVVSYDADSKSVTVFTDMLGNKILERTAAGDTYYVYNDLGQLRFVLPPAYNNSVSNAMFAYEYRYDYRGRLQSKTLPQCDTIHYSYDCANRISFTRDAALGDRYRFYLYDKLGRVCVQGTCSSRGEDGSVLATAVYVGGYAGICNSGYSALYDINDPELEIVNYYDNYDFMEGGTSDKMPVVTVSDNQRQYALGFQTGTVVYATNGEALGTICLYDQKGQITKSVRKGLGGFLEDVSNTYTFTGAVDRTRADVYVKYGNHFIAETDYTYSHGLKSNMKLSISHGMSVVARETEYNYNGIGQLISKRRQLTNTAWTSCSYSYDVHGWLTSIISGAFTERLYYADGLGGGYYNGNISTIKWKDSNSSSYQGYNLEYDDNNRLSNAIFGYGDNLTSNRNYFNEYAEYDDSGNIIRLRRGGLVDRVHGGFGMVDNLTMTYIGNRLTNVRDNAFHQAYTGATDFAGEQGRDYSLTYDNSGSLVSDAGRNIAKIEYDNFNNPTRVQFTDGNVTRYIYSALGEKLRVIYQTAVPNITVAIGSTRELSPSEVQYTDSIDYLLGGTLTLKNGRIDKYQFDEGYCQAERYNTSMDSFTFCYYDRDHLGNIRQVREADGSRSGEVIQKINYYPFGAQLCDGVAVSNVQSRKYNGKEYDNMHGLNTYDYGARQYNPVTVRWDRMDTMCEKYYDVSPYAYCAGDPVNAIDLDGKDYWTTNNPDQIFQFLKAIGLGNTQFDFSEWNHATDADFCGNLVYNDESHKFYTSYAEVTNGELVVTAKSFDANIIPVSSTGLGYPGAFIYEPINGFWENANYYLNGLTYNDGFTNWNVNRNGRITGETPILGIADFGGKSKASYIKSILPKGFKLSREYISHNERVYEYNGKYYSFDNTSHNGGIWKVFVKKGGRLQRIGTADKNLNIFKK